MKYLFFALTALSLSACNWGLPHNTPPAITRDTLSYTKNRFISSGPYFKDGPVKTDSKITLMEITYPQFKDQPVLNDSVKKNVTSLFTVGGKADTSFKQLSDDFLTAYLDYYKTATASSDKVQFMLKNAAIITRQDSSLITLEFNGHTYQGGAHGNSLTRYFNWNTKARKKILLGDVLVAGYQTKLTAIADTIFRKQEKLSNTASLANGYFFKNNQFALNSNFIITPTGISFLYNEYEIKPYAAGQTELSIPYSKIKSLLLPHTVISQYIK
jgi:hypothetical protein